jgi:hypothetical protein
MDVAAKLSAERRERDQDMDQVVETGTRRGSGGTNRDQDMDNVGDTDEGGNIWERQGTRTWNR